MLLATMNWPAVEQYLKTKRTVIVPVGSTEQHGPNGLFCTDHIIPERLAAFIGERTKTLVAPTVTYGMSNHHLGFPGTVSLNSSTFMAVLKDICDCFHRHGFKNIFFLNGHGGNSAPASAAFSELLQTHQLEIVFRNWWEHPAIFTMSKEFFGDREGSHGTPSEVSVTKYFFPDKVIDIPSPWRDEKIKIAWPPSPEKYRQVFPDGLINADPSMANYDKGKALFDKAVEIFSQEVTDFNAGKFIPPDGH